MADMRNRTPFYGAVPTSKLNADHVFMADGSTLQEQADKNFELIEEITLTEAAALIERTAEPDGTEYNFKHIYIETYTPQASTTTSGRVNVNSNLLVTRLNNFMRSDGVTYASSLVLSIFGIFKDFQTQGNATYRINQTYTCIANSEPAEIIKKITIDAYSNNIPVDSVIKIYAVRA